MQAVCTLLFWKGDHLPLSTWHPQDFLSRLSYHPKLGWVEFWKPSSIWGRGVQRPSGALGVRSLEHFPKVSCQTEETASQPELFRL